MNVLCVILIALAVLLVSALLFAFLVKVRIVFEVTKVKGEAFKNSIRITFFGGKVGFNLKDLTYKNKSKTDVKKEKNDEKILNKIKNYMKTFKILKEVYSTNKFFVRDRLVLEDTKAYVKFGFGDAAVTGIATGAVWSLLYQILAFLSSIGTVRDHDFDVVPVYNERGFCLNVNGIISFRMINIIRVVLKLVRTYRKIIRETNKN